MINGNPLPLIYQWAASFQEAVRPTGSNLGSVLLKDTSACHMTGMTQLNHVFFTVVVFIIRKLIVIV